MNEKGNAVIIDGKRYDLVEDTDQVGKCDRCALRKQCDEYTEQFEQGAYTLCEVFVDYRTALKSRYELKTDYTDGTTRNKRIP